MIGFLPPLALLQQADELSGEPAHVLVQGLLPGESVHKLQDYRGGTIGIENLLDGLGDHSVNDLGRDRDCCPLVVGDDAKEFEVEDVEGVGDLRDRYLL